MGALNAEVPRALLPLLSPKRYKGAYGGRGGAKSHFFAEQIIVRCYASATRAVCIREVQQTIKDSVRQLLVNKIQKLGLGQAFDVLESEIRGVRGTSAEGSLIVFKGMQSYNAENIKSLEDFDIAWVEEAQTLSENSLKLLRPTIRKEGSELWFSWNPRHDTDAVDKFFRGGDKRTSMVAVPVNWHDNPWFPEVLRVEKDEDYAADEEVAEHVWGGGYERITKGAYYAKHIAALERAGRMGFFPYDPKLGPVYTSWDLGVDDYTAIWFFQIYEKDGASRVRIIDYFESSDIGADEILKYALPEYSADLQERVEGLIEIGRDQAYKYQRHFFPHDIGMREWGAGAKTRVQTVNELGIPLSTIHRGVAQNPEERINATRRLLPMCEFNQSSNVVLGITRLRRYTRKLNEALGLYLGPAKDGNDHGADAFGEFAINCGIHPPKPAEESVPKPKPGQFMPPPVQQRSPTRLKI